MSLYVNKDKLQTSPKDTWTDVSLSFEFQQMRAVETHMSIRFFNDLLPMGWKETEIARFETISEADTGVFGLVAKEKLNRCGRFVKKPVNDDDITCQLSFNIECVFGSVVGNEFRRKGFPCVPFFQTVCESPKTIVRDKCADSVFWKENVSDQGIPLYEAYFENVENAETLKDVLDRFDMDPSRSENEVASLLVQVGSYLQLLRATVEGAHNDLHSRNVLCRRLGKKVWIPLWDGRAILTNVVAVVVDHGKASFNLPECKVDFFDKDQLTGHDRRGYFFHYLTSWARQDVSESQCESVWNNMSALQKNRSLDNVSFWKMLNRFGRAIQTSLPESFHSALKAAGDLDLQKCIMWLLQNSGNELGTKEVSSTELSAQRNQVFAQFVDDVPWLCSPFPVFVAIGLGLDLGTPDDRLWELIFGESVRMNDEAFAIWNSTEGSMTKADLLFNIFKHLIILQQNAQKVNLLDSEILKNVQTTKKNVSVLVDRCEAAIKKCLTKTQRTLRSSGNPRTQRSSSIHIPVKTTERGKNHHKVPHQTTQNKQTSRQSNPLKQRKLPVHCSVKSTKTGKDHPRVLHKTTGTKQSSR